MQFSAQFCRKGVFMDTLDTPLDMDPPLGNEMHSHYSGKYIIIWKGVSLRMSTPIISIPIMSWCPPKRRPISYTHFLTSDLADGKNIQFTIRILSRPTFSITVTDRRESPGKSLVGDTNDGSRKCKSPGSNHPPSAPNTSTKAPTIATQLSLALQQVLRFHSRY